MRDLDLIRSYRDDVTEPDDAKAAARGRLAAHIAAEGERRTRHRRRRGIALITATAVLVSGTAAAAGLLRSSDDLDLGSVSCLERAGTLAEHTGRTVVIEPADDPVSACAARWRSGDMDGRPHAAPPLAACASPGDPVIVVPGTEATCRGLALEPLPHDYPAAAASLGKAKAALQRDDDLRGPRSACEPPSAKLARAHRLLAAAGVRDVRVELGGDGPCAGFFGFTGGRDVQVELISRDEAAAAWARQRISLVVEKVLEETHGCTDPLEVAARARQALRHAGLPRADVRVDESGGACVDRSGFIVEAGGATLHRAPR